MLALLLLIGAKVRNRRGVVAAARFDSFSTSSTLYPARADSTASFRAAAGEDTDPAPSDTHILAGDITDTDVLVSWFTELNRFARIKVNVITFGDLGVDPEFLKALAERNGGVFVQVPEVK